MSVTDTLSSLVLPARPTTALPKAIPTDVTTRTTRGRAAMKKNAAYRRLCMRFRRGDTYWSVAKGILMFDSTADVQGGRPKPPHRIRNRYDFIGPIIDAKVSAATQRVPSYEVNPAHSDQQTMGAAKLAEQVALYGYDQWRLRDATTKTVDLAIGGGGVGYALPYFDPNVGPYIEVEDDNGNVELVGQGEIRVLVLTGNQTYSEPGVDFDYSPWYAIERARPIDEVEALDGYVAGRNEKLVPDANTSDIPSDRVASDNLVMVTEYFERPSAKYPDGRCMTFANGRPIIDYRRTKNAQDATDWWGPYPLVDHRGRVLDEPILHRLVYRHDADTDTDLGLTWRLIDFQRTIQDIYNKMAEYKNRGLYLQMLAPVGSKIQRRGDTPGGIVLYQPTGNAPPPDWEPPPPPQILNALLAMLERTVNDMRDVAADVSFDIAPNVATTTAEYGVEQARDKWQSFLGDLAEWHSRVMRHGLMLVARHYSEARLLAIRGRNGWERISDFLGEDLLGQTDVRVFPQSLVVRTRQQVQQELAWIQANWPGYLSPEVAIAALHGGTADKLIEGFELDMARVNGIIQAIQDGTVLDLPPRLDDVPPAPDPVTGQLGPGGVQSVPQFMPAESDSLPIWKRVFGDFMKTQQYDQLPPPMQDVTQKIWAGIKLREAAQQAQQQAVMNAQAQDLGAQNAAKPQIKGVPSQPGVSAPAQLTP